MDKSVYMDSRGWIYKVAGIGGDIFKARYCKPNKKIAYQTYHCCRQFEWRSSFIAAQADLDAYAQQHGWKKIFGEREIV